jgi:hypothetical protein
VGGTEARSRTTSTPNESGFRRKLAIFSTRYRGTDRLNERPLRHFQLHLARDSAGNPCCPTDSGLSAKLRPGNLELRVQGGPESIEFSRPEALSERYSLGERLLRGGLIRVLQ